VSESFVTVIIERGN